MTYKVDMSLPPQEVLLGQINYENKTSFTLEQVGFREDGVHETTRYDKDTMIWLEAKKGTYGLRRIYYDRIDLAEFLGERVMEIDVSKAGYKETHLLIPEVLKRLGINLDRTDIISDIVHPGVREFDIRISPRSIVYRGTIRVRYTNFLTDRFSKTILDGFQLTT